MFLFVFRPLSCCSLSIASINIIAQSWQKNFFYLALFAAQEFPPSVSKSEGEPCVKDHPQSSMRWRSKSNLARPYICLLIVLSLLTLPSVRRLSLVAQIARQAYEPRARSLELLRTAGAVAPELAEQARQIETRRRQNQARLIAYLHECQVLPQNLSLEEATDVLWALTSYDLYRMLVVEQGWASVRYETWLAQLLIQNLLRPADE